MRRYFQLSRITATLPARPPRAASLEEVVAAYDRFAQATESLGASGDLEVAVLARTNGRRAFRRLERDEVTELLGG